MRAIKIIKSVSMLLIMMAAGGANSAEPVTGWKGGDTPVVVRGGTLIDVRSGRLTENAVIVVKGDEIVSVGQDGPVPAGATVLDATGKYIIPGLIDLHIHYKEWSGPLYLNHGITTVVSLGDTHDWIRAQKDGIKRGTILGPRLFMSTENLDKTPEDLSDYFIRPHNRLFDDAEAALAGMREYIQNGVDAVKVYDDLTVPQLKVIVAEANKANIPVIGHFPDVRIAMEVGAHGIEHSNAVALAITDEKFKQDVMKRVRKGFRLPPESFMDVKRIPEIVKMMVDKGIFLNPTIRGYDGGPRLREKGFHYQDFDLLFNNWGTRFIPIQWVLANLKEYQEIGLWNWQDLSDYEIEIFDQGYRNLEQLIKAFVDAGGKLYAGTDSANMATPGLSMHQELELLVDAGVSPLVALQAATINPAELMRMSERLGALEKGKVGDLVVLDGNPLEDITNTRKIWRVVSRGEVLDGKYDGGYRNPIPQPESEQSSHFFPSPQIKTISPQTFRETTGVADATLTVSGTGLIPYSLVRWNEKVLETEFVSETELKARVPKELLGHIGKHVITVENPDFGYGSIFARGASDIAHLGVRGHISNEINVLVVYGK